jgi:broad specificity phosphatase PhoE
MTTVYLIRHSIKEKNYNIVNSNDSEQIIDEKEILSIEGEESAKFLSDNIEFLDIDELWASNYVRTIQTAKYISKKNNLKINISSSFDERHYGTFGVDINKEQFEDFWIGQFKNLSLKNADGESGFDVCRRIDEKISEIISNNRGKRIAIVGHNASIIFYLLKYCKLVNAEPIKKLTISFKDNILIKDGIMKAPSFFKLVFDDNNNLVDLSYHTID